MKQMKILTVNGQSYQITDEEALHYTPQSLTAEQKAQGRENLDACTWQEAADKLCTDFTGKGTVVSCQPVAELPVTVESSFAATQSGSGTASPDNVRKITGHDSINLSITGKNLFGGEAFADAFAAKGGTKNTDGTIAFQGNMGGKDYNWIFRQFNPNTQYTFIFYGQNSAKTFNLAVWYTETLSSGATYEIINPSAVGADEYVVYTSRPGKTVRAFGTIAYLGGTTTLHYDKCGIFEGVVTKDAFEAYKGSTVTIDLGQTVYGGTFNWSTGVLTLTHACKTIESLSSMQTVGYGNIYLGANVLPSNYGTTVCVISSHYNGILYDPKYPNYSIYAPSRDGLVIVDRTHLTSEDAAKAYFAEQKAAGTPVQVCYKLSTPKTVQLTPREILALSGTNNLFSNTGDTQVSGKADTNAVIQDLYNKLNALSATMAALTGV